jgi:hypothetical protein
MLQHEFFDLVLEDITVAMKYNTRAIKDIEDNLRKYEIIVAKGKRKNSTLPPLQNTTTVTKTTLNILKNRLK